jgi:hypothetical protein
VKVGLIDVDESKKFPNLALMKISAYHKSRGDTVGWAYAMEHYDIVYQSKVFDDTYSRDIDWIPNADVVIKGGTGYGLDNVLPDEIEHQYPDYGLYPDITKDTAYGFLSRGCPRHCEFCIVGDKEGLRSVKVADLSEFWRGQKYIKLLDPNLLCCKDRLELLDQLADSRAYVDFTQGLDIRAMNPDVIDRINRIRLKEIHFAWDNPKQDLRTEFSYYAGAAKHKPHGDFGTVYVLTNFNSSIEEDLYRIYTLREMGYLPDVRVYDKPNAPKEIRDLQRWCNNRRIFKSCPRFEDYDRRK